MQRTIGATFWENNITYIRKIFEMYLEPSPSDIGRPGACSVVSSQTEIEKSVQNCDKKILCGIFITIISLGDQFQAR